MRRILASSVGLLIVAVLPLAAADNSIDFGSTGTCEPLFKPNNVFGPLEPILSSVPVTVTPPPPPTIVPEMISSLPVTPAPPTAQADLCGTSQFGTLSVAAVDCDEAGCEMEVVLQAHGWTSAAGLLHLRAFVWLGGDEIDKRDVCVRAALVSSSVSCAGSEGVRMDVPASQCFDFFRVQTELEVDPADPPPQHVTAWQSTTVLGFKLCRDADGSPFVEELAGCAPGGCVPGIEVALVVAALALVAVTVRRLGPR